MKSAFYTEMLQNSLKEQQRKHAAVSSQNRFTKYKASTDLTRKIKTLDQ